MRQLAVVHTLTAHEIIEYPSDGQGIKSRWRQRTEPVSFIAQRNQVVAGFEAIDEAHWAIRMYALSYPKFAGLRADTPRCAVLDGATGAAWHFTVASTRTEDSLHNSFYGPQIGVPRVGSTEVKFIELYAFLFL